MSCWPAVFRDVAASLALTASKHTGSSLAYPRLAHSDHVQQLKHKLSCSRGTVRSTSGSERTSCETVSASGEDSAGAQAVDGASRRVLLRNLALLTVTLQSNSAAAPKPAAAALVQFPTTHLRNRYILVNTATLDLVQIMPSRSSTAIL